MIETNRFNQNSWLGSPMQYSFGNGSRIQFKSFDSVGKAKAAGKRDVLFLNEANHINYNIADALMMRSNETWIDFNPDAEFWAHTEVLTEPNSELLILTYEDNEACPPERVEELHYRMNKAFFNPLDSWDEPSNVKSEYWANWCRIYIRGEVGKLDGVIFTNWKQIDSIPNSAKLLGYGIDFGYTNDPSTLIALYKWNNVHIWDELLYQRGLKNSQIAKRMQQLGVKNRDFVVADSSEPKSIDEINEYGFHVIPATKGADSIKFGIDLLQENDFLVTSSSTNLVTELRRYSWLVDKSGKSLNIPIDDYNHLIDPMRYLGVEKISKQRSTRGRGIRRKN